MARTQAIVFWRCHAAPGTGDLNAIIIEQKEHGLVSASLLRGWEERNATHARRLLRARTAAPNVFVHISAVEKAGYTNLVEGARVSYELATGRSGKSFLGRRELSRPE